MSLEAPFPAPVPGHELLAVVCGCSCGVRFVVGDYRLVGVEFELHLSGAAALSGGAGRSVNRGAALRPGV